MNYTGIYYFSLPENDDLARFYENPSKFADRLKENQYLILENNEYEAIDFYKKKNGWLERVSYPTFESQFCGVMKPRNPEQRCAMDLIHSDVPIKLITGPFGSGKSMIMIEGMIEALQKGKVDKIVFIRNNVQVKDTDALGALPGLF